VRIGVASARPTPSNLASARGWRRAKDQSFAVSIGFDTGRRAGLAALEFIKWQRGLGPIEPIKSVPPLAGSALRALSSPTI
jgi:hypothetical protein